MFWCAHSRHSGVLEASLNEAHEDGRVRVLATGREAGPTLFESADGRFLMHVGHPEYEPARLAEEGARDARLGRADVEPLETSMPQSPCICGADIARSSLVVGSRASSRRERRLARDAFDRARARRTGRVFLQQQFVRSI